MKRILLTVLVLVLVLLLQAGRVLAAYLQAPTSLTINSVYVLRHLAETDDMLVVFHYNIPYSSDNYSDTPASKSMILRFYADNGTLMQTGSIYVYPYFGSNGYGDGVGSFYWAADDDQPDWDGTHAINIYGVEADGYFDPADDVETSYNMTDADWTTATTQDANRELLEDWVFLECDVLETAYTDSGVVMISSSDTGLVLSPYGESYFRGAIPGLQQLAPDLFFIQVLIPEAMTIQDYDMSMAANYTARLTGDDLGTGFTRLGEFIGLEGTFAAGAVNFVLVLAFAIYCHKRNWGAEIGLGGGAIITLGMALLVGDPVFTAMMIGTFVAGGVIIWLTLLRRA